MNRVELIGGLVRPPELAYTANGYPYARFTLAVNDTRYSKEAGGQIAVTSYISCQVWGSMAEVMVGRDHRQGEKLWVLGALDQSEYEDREGKKVSKTRVKVHLSQSLEPDSDGWEGDAPEPVGDEAPF